MSHFFKKFILLECFINPHNQKKIQFMEPNEWVLPFLYIGTGTTEKPAVRGSLMLFKQFFVFIKEIKPDLDEFYHFIPYDYGPYSFELKQVMDSLISRNFIDIFQNEERIDYYLTEKGIQKAQNTLKNVDDRTTQKILRLRNDANRLGYFGVLRYVYSKYPEYTTASKIKNLVINDS